MNYKERNRSRSQSVVSSCTSQSRSSPAILFRAPLRFSCLSEDTEGRENIMMNDEDHFKKSYFTHFTFYTNTVPCSRPRFGSRARQICEPRE